MTPDIEMGIGCMFGCGRSTSMSAPGWVRCGYDTVRWRRLGYACPECALFHSDVIKVGLGLWNGRDERSGAILPDDYFGMRTPDMERWS